jgi:hypothetical protein
MLDKIDKNGNIKKSKYQHKLVVLHTIDTEWFCENEKHVPYGYGR